jgi:hypothetical protein
MVDCNPDKTPLEKNLHLNRNENREEPNVPYQCLIGSVMYFVSGLDQTLLKLLTV